MKIPVTFPRFLWFWANINRNPCARAERRGLADEVRRKCSNLFGDKVQIEVIVGAINIERGKKHRTVTSKIAASLKHLH